MFIYYYFLICQSRIKIDITNINEKRIIHHPNIPELNYRIYT